MTSSLLHAQDPDAMPADSGTFSIPADTISIPADSLQMVMNDSIGVTSDSLLADTLGTARTDVIETEVNYDASDSIIFSMDGGTVELFGGAIITYGDIRLESEYIRYEMDISEVIASEVPDSSGESTIKPIFSEGEDSYEAKYLRYNFKTQRGFIEEVITEQEGGFLHSSETKKHKTGHIHMRNGKFTTCDAEHPHFYVAITKGISMPGDKIISGPAYLVLEDVPLPIGIPFGFFPNSRKKTSGILIPQYGEEERRGFYLRDGGYYFALNDYMDLRLTGDIYSNGTWGVRASSNYRLRYKFNGSVNVQFFNNVSGFKLVEDTYTRSRDYSINWSHGQAREANPNRTFRASVNLSSSSYDQLHTRNINNVVTNTKQSSVSYTKSWPNSPFNLSASLNHSQNSNTGAVNMSLPKVSFNMSRINPFKKKNRVGEKKWYEDIQLSYSSLLENRIETGDSILFNERFWTESIFDNGFRHEVPLSLNVKPFNTLAGRYKVFRPLQTMTITPNVSYKGMVYTSYTEKYADYEFEEADGVTTYTATVRDSSINRLTYAHSYLPRVSASVSPKVYGMYQFTGKGRLTAIRHMMTPSASFSYVPDMGPIQPDYYRDVVDTISGEVIQTYSIFEDQIYGTPTFNGASGSVSLSLKNNIEAKLKPKSDSIEEMEKIKLLDNLNFSTSYNVFHQDSLSPAWAPINMNGNTRLFNNKLSVNFRGQLDPFGYDSLRTRTAETFYSQTGKLLRLTNASISMGISFKSNNKGKEDVGEDPDDPLTETAFDSEDVSALNTGYDPREDDYLGEYVDFEVPWSLKLDYSLSYTKRTDVAKIIQTVRASGDLSLTPKWKIGFNTGYDLANRQFTTTNLSLYRDLHCWEMRISVVPFGRYKSYNFQINAKSSILSDLKYNRRKAWQDNF